MKISKPTNAIMLINTLVQSSLSQVMQMQELRRAFVERMEFYLGARMTPIILREIEDEYLGGQMDAMTCFIERPDLFEKAFHGILGSASHNIIAMICEDIRSELNLPTSISYAHGGNLKECIMKLKAMMQKDRKILLVDDDKDNAETIKLLIECEGIAVDVFNDPLHAISNFKPEVYGLALIDFKMPRMTGFELYEKMVVIQRSLKVLFISAYELLGHDQFLQKHPDLSTDSFLRKPLDPKLLLQVVKHRLAGV